jgi:hypothetical protein
VSGFLTSHFNPSRLLASFQGSQRGDSERKGFSRGSAEMYRSFVKGLAASLLLAAPATASAQDFKARCETLAQTADSAGRVTEAAFTTAGPVQLAPHPQVATYAGSGDVEKAESFSCK